MSKGFDKIRIDHRTRGEYSTCPFCGRTISITVMSRNETRCPHIHAIYLKGGYWRWKFVKQICKLELEKK
jgi:hypothetical protein